MGSPPGRSRHNAAPTWRVPDNEATLFRAGFLFRPEFILRFSRCPVLGEARGYQGQRNAFDSFGSVTLD